MRFGSKPVNGLNTNKFSCSPIPGSPSHEAAKLFYLKARHDVLQIFLIASHSQTPQSHVNSSACIAHVPKTAPDLEKQLGSVLRADDMSCLRQKPALFWKVLHEKTPKIMMHFFCTHLSQTLKQFLVINSCLCLRIGAEMQKVFTCKISTEL